MATISAQNIDLAGVDPTFSAASAGGDNFNNGPGQDVLLRIKNAAGVARTVTIAAASECSHGFSHNVVVAMADGDDVTLGPFERARFNGAGGLVAVTYDSETGLTLAVLKVTKPGTSENEGG